MNIGNNIKRLRNSKNVTQEQLGNMIDKSTISIRKYESGETDLSIGVLSKIAVALDVSINELIGATDLTNEDEEMLDFLYGEGLVQLRDILKEFNYKLSDDEKGNIVIYKDGDIIAIIPEKEFIDLGRKKLEYIKEFSEFQIGKLIDDYKFLY